MRCSLWTLPRYGRADDSAFQGLRGRFASVILIDFVPIDLMGRPMSYTSEVEVKDALGLPDWRHLRKEHVLRLMSMLSDMDSRVALNILGQLPDIAMFARVAVEDVAKGHEATLSSNARSMEMVHEVHLARLDLLRGELERDGLSVDERRHLVNQVREVHADALAKDTENKRFLSEQFDKRLVGVVAGALALAAVVFAAAKAGSKRPVS